MRIGQIVKLSLKSILSSKMRSFLTMLGMIIGVGAVITLLGLMNGVTNYIVDQFSDMGTNLVTVTVNNTDTRVVSVDEMYEFAEENHDLFTGVTPKVSANYTVKNGNDSITTSVVGIGEDYLELNSLSLSRGRFINYADIKNRYSACVIGTYIVDELFGGTVSLGDTIRINGQIYTIVGIQEEEADSEEGSTDDIIYIPYSNAARLAGSSDISSYSFSTIDSDTVSAAETALDNFLYMKMKDEDLYSIMSMTQLLDVITSMTSMLSSVLAGIAGISLVVAGIGIMNIMLVSVVERTKEIGIRKSLGAKKSDIMGQFVSEAVMISCFGGILGIALGIAACRVVGNLFDLSASPTVGTVMLAFGVSAGIGIAFGYMPAKRAAGLNPIDALRSE